jgi:hypothetical protein
MESLSSPCIKVTNSMNSKAVILLLILHIGQTGYYDSGRFVA